MLSDLETDVPVQLVHSCFVGLNGDCTPENFSSLFVLWQNSKAGDNGPRCSAKMQAFKCRATDAARKSSQFYLCSPKSLIFLKGLHKLYNNCHLLSNAQRNDKAPSFVIMIWLCRLLNGFGCLLRGIRKQTLRCRLVKDCVTQLKQCTRTIQRTPWVNLDLF